MLVSPGPHLELAAATVERKGVPLVPPVVPRSDLGYARVIAGLARWYRAYARKKAPENHGYHETAGDQSPPGYCLI